MTNSFYCLEKNADFIPVQDFTLLTQLADPLAIIISKKLSQFYDEIKKTIKQKAGKKRHWISTYSIVQIFKNEFLKLEDDLRVYMSKRGTKGIIYT